jgi:16S rRNA (cytosine967-C5)-methyltransferase
VHKLQRLAANVVGAVLEGKSLPHALNAQWVIHPGTNAQQRAMVQDASYGVIRHRGTLDAILAQLARKGLKDEPLRHLLLVALYQLAYSRTAPHAVVDHAVQAAAGRGPGAKGFVNAVLRSYLRDAERLGRAAAATPRGRYSYPDWWIERIRETYPDRCAEILDAGNSRAPLTLRVNTRRTTPEAYLLQLRNAGIEGTAIGSAGIILAEPMRVEALPGFDDGLFSVQDYGAQLAAPLLQPRDGMLVLDACAAPGGKSAHLLELADIDLTCIDSDPLRLVRLRQNLGRLKLSAKVIEGDAADTHAWWDGHAYDRILADVPCSASGVVRRHPDVKWLRRESDLSSLAAQQSRLLRALWTMLKPGGHLLYATCSLFHEENEDRVAEFCAGCAEAQRLPLPIPGIPSQLLPSAQGAAHNQDGFFYALIAKSF